MSVTIHANKSGIEVRIYNDDCFNVYDSDYVPWEDVAEFIAPYLIDRLKAIEEKK